VQDYLDTIQETLKDNPDTIFINLDETACFFEMSGDYCLDISSSKKTWVRTCGKDKERCTVIPIIASNGHLFPPIIIFKT